MKREKEVVLREKPDFVLVDVKRADVRRYGVEIINELPQETSFIGLNAEDDFRSVMFYLNRGADHVEREPLNPEVLMAHMKAILRRRKGEVPQKVVEFGGLKFDFEGRSATVNEEDVRLSRKEFLLMSYFALNKDRIVSLDEIIEDLWGEGEQRHKSSAMTLISRLRTKIKDSDNQIIKTVRNKGYVFGEIPD